MEQTRMLLAIVLSFVVLIAWQMIFVDEKAIQEKEAPPPEKSIVQEAPFEKEKAVADFKADPLPSTPEKVGRMAREITVETNLFIAQLSEKGAVLKSLRLKGYRETIEPDSPMKEVLDSGNPLGTLLCSFKKNSLPGISTALYQAEDVADELVADIDKVVVPFRWVDGSGVILEKRFVFSPDSYQIDLEINVMNGSNIPIQDQLTVSLIDAIPDNPRRIGHTGPSAMIGQQVTQIDLDDIAEKSTYPGNITWTAFQNRYFMSGLMPKAETEASLHYVIGSNGHLESQLILAETIIRPETKQSFSFQGYFGPKNIRILKTVGKNLDQVVDFGWFSFIARPCLWIMNHTYQVIPNYGIAIIILTLLTKIALWPLGNKSYKSMGQMKKMQPLMADIRERYKNDKQRMNQELMSLYKTYKVNPLGGCLPMLLQIPIFFALYRMLYEAIELRHAPFFGWINDLSAPDRLFSFGFKIPFMEPPYGIPVLTLIMGGSMFLQQKMQPPMGDATQAKMMLIFMPIFMTVIFINFSSGLVLYWLVSNILGILQQYYVTKKTA